MDWVLLIPEYEIGVQRINSRSLNDLAANNSRVMLNTNTGGIEEVARYQAICQYLISM